MASATWPPRLTDVVNAINPSFVAPVQGDMAPRLLVNSCGRFLSLRTGSLVIAYYYLVADLIMCTTLISGEGFLEAVKETLDEELHHRLPEIKDTEGIMLGLWFLMLPFITALLVGLHKNIALYVKAFLLAIFFYFALELTMLICCLLFYRINYYIVAARVIAIIIDAYFFIVVRSHYYKMTTQMA